MKINVSIDDISPHPSSSIKCLDKCFKLIEAFPDIKFTLFIPTRYCRSMDHNNEEYNIFDHQYFIDKINSLPKNNFEVGYHGLNHGIFGESNNDEFESLNYEQALSKLTMCKKDFKSCNIDVRNIFRPPAFRLSPESLKACYDFGIDLVSLNSGDMYKKVYCGFDEMDKYKHMINYVDCFPPFVGLFKKDSLEIMYHACEWDKNYFSDVFVDNLINFINKSDDVEFVFINDLVGG